MVRGGLWWFVMVRGGSWWFVMVRGGSSWFVMVHVLSWFVVVSSWFVMVHVLSWFRGGSSWFVVVCGGLWWFVSFSLKFSRKYHVTHYLTNQSPRFSIKSHFE